MSPKTNKCEDWAQNAIDNWLNTLNQQKLTFKKIVFVIKKCLYVMGLDDACKYMVKHKLTVTDENIKIFMSVADKYSLMRMKILEKLVLDENKNNPFDFTTCL